MSNNLLIFILHEFTEICMLKKLNSLCYKIIALEFEIETYKISAFKGTSKRFWIFKGFTIHFINFVLFQILPEDQSDQRIPMK